MTTTQKRILLLTLGILLLSVTIFRENNFAGNNASIWAYRILAMSGLIISALAFGRLFGRKIMWLFLGLLIFSEIILALLFKVQVAGAALPQKMTDLLGYIYLHRCRDYIMYDHERGRWDKDVFYTLKPGEFEYSNMEFSTQYSVNSMGFRDDEKSLEYPEVIFLGDSHTMGWGVEEKESWPYLMENKLGMLGLNTGIASYGTAREYLTFKKIKSDSCKLLFLQYCPNDARENISFWENGNELKVSPDSKFNQEVVWNNLYRKYYPLKYIHSVFYYFGEKIKMGRKTSVSYTPIGGVPPKEVEAFFKFIKKIRTEYDGPIYLFNIGMGVTKPGVTRQFQKWLLENPILNVHIFPASEYLEKEDYLPLDTHLTVEGNRKLAEGLLGFLK